MDGVKLTGIDSAWENCNMNVNGNTGDVTMQKQETTPSVTPPVPRQSDDPVEHPAHYTRDGFDFIQAIENLPYLRGAAMKYIYRAGIKEPAKEIEDLRKARWMIDREIARLSK